MTNQGHLKPILPELALLICTAAGDRGLLFLSWFICLLIPEDYFYKTEYVFSTKTVVVGGRRGEIGTMT